MVDQLEASVWPAVRQVARWQSSDEQRLNTLSGCGWLMVYVHHGPATLQFEQMTYDLRSGSWLIQAVYQSDDIRISRSTAVEPYDVYTLYLRSDQIKTQDIDDPDGSLLTFRQAGGPQHTSGDSFNLILPQQHHVQSAVIRYQMVQFLTTAVFQCTRGDVYSRTLCSLSVLEVLVRLSADYLQHTNNCYHTVPDGYISEVRVQQVMEYLHQEFSCKISGDDLSRQIGVNFDHLNRQFRRRMGQTIFVYLNHLRVQHACRLLEEKHLGLHEIATSSGFSDEYRFSKVFKQIVGTTPRRYQQALTGQTDRMV